MKSIAPLLSVLAVSLMTACTSPTESTVDYEDGLAAFSADSLKKHVAVLASDEFMGRMPFTEGETKTIDYLQKQFKAVGLEAGNGDSYLQEVPMVNIEATAAPTMQVQTPRTTMTLDAFDDYVIWTDRTEPDITPR